VRFIKARFRPNSLRLWNMVRECNKWYLTHTAAIEGDIGTKECCSRKGKVPFLSARFRPNVHRRCSMERVCQVWCLIHTAPMCGEIRRKILSASRGKYPSLLPDFDKTCTGCGAWGGSATCCAPVTPLQYKARHGRETVLTSGVKCPSLVLDFDQTFTDRGTRGVCARRGV
jgi:hypothetical protein